jgi:hypothetical protein
LLRGALGLGAEADKSLDGNAEEEAFEAFLDPGLDP